MKLLFVFLIITQVIIIVNIKIWGDFWSNW